MITTENSVDLFSFKLFQSRIEPKIKFIKYICTDGLCGGWADRLEGIFSTYALSLLTDRNFSIYIDSPCSIETLIEPNEINWNAGDDKKIMTSRNLHLIDNFNFIERLEKARNLTNFEKYTSLLKIETNQDWLTTLSSNRNLHAKIKSLGYEPSKFQIKYLTYNW